MRAIVGVGGLFARCASCATTPAALSVPPSPTWYGDDGTWSAVSIRVGSPQQWIDVLVNTVSSETWIPGAGSCVVNDTLCVSNKGGIFSPLKSSTWQEEGFFDLGVDYQLGNTGYAEYGLDNLTFGTTGITIPTAIIGTFNGSEGTNTTSYFNGLFGLGITPGNFTNITPLSAIAALVEQVGAIPSHSYGYTPGASYRFKGVLSSLTLGGYDANRFVPHNITFTLSSSKVPQAFINSITVTSPATSSTAATSVSLLSAVDRVTAIIDSSTPFLWLPTTVCERFASALGLSYNATLNLYTFDTNASQHDILAASNLTFSFSLSNFDASTDLVTINLPYAAFDLQLIYPAIPNTHYGGADSTKFYFPLRQALNEAQYTIGRAFLQEAYIITDYERNNFSVYQAVHPLNSVDNTSIVAILRPTTSTLTGNPPDMSTDSKSTFPKGAIIGSSVGAAALVFASITFCILLYRQHHRKALVSDDKVFDVPTPRRTLMDVMDLLFPRREPPVVVHEAIDSEVPRAEFPIGLEHERFELDVPPNPVELESESGASMDGSTQHGTATQDSTGLSEYERARRKLERQLNASIRQSYARPIPAPTQKQETDVSPVAHYRPPEQLSGDSPMISPMVPDFGRQLSVNTLPPSPVSPGFPTSPLDTPLSPPPPPVYRRINPDHVVYAGRLPDNVRLAGIVPRIIEPDGRTMHPEADEPNAPEDVNTCSSLGSQYTIQEEMRNVDLYNADTPPGLSPVGNNSLGSGHGSEIISPITSTTSGSGTHTFGLPNSQESVEMEMLRADGRTQGDDLVHVPQLAENRFSWESGRDP